MHKMDKVKEYKVNLSKFNNSWYQPGNKFKIILWYFTNAIVFKSSFPFPISFKVFLLKSFGAKVDSGVVIKPGVSIKYPWKLKIGANTWLGENVWIDNLDDIVIGANACLSQGVLLLSGNHNFKSSSFDLMIKPIILEDGVWLGAKSVVTQGVTCKSHAVLSVGSVTSKDLDAYTIYKGNPAIAIRKRTIVE